MRNQRANIPALILITILVTCAFVIWRYPLKLGLDLQGGTHIILEAKDTEAIKITPETIAGTIAVIRNRVDGIGISEPIIQQKGSRQVVVDFPGIKNPNQAIRLIGQTAQLEFREAEWAPPGADRLPTQNLATLLGKNGQLATVSIGDGSRPIILRSVAITGADLKHASPGTDPVGKPVVNIEFTDVGREKFARVTQQNIGKPLAILLDNRIISAPNINDAIVGGRAEISGQFTPDEMRDLVIKLNAGALPVPIEIVSTKIVGPSLGRDSIEKSKIAGIAGFLLVCAFMGIVYRISGGVANVALILYVVIFLAIIKLLGITLTLPGIAGLILTIGMAVDANVLIFERIKEEMGRHPTDLAAIRAGFSRAFITILDSNVTTLISAVVLFWLGAGSIRGFGVTLSLGILISMFTAVYASRVMLENLPKKYQTAPSFGKRTHESGNPI